VVALGLLALLVLVRVFVAEPFSIPSESMAPTLSPGDHVLVDKLAYRGGGEPRAGELVAFDAPDSEGVMLKRVVALGGQSVEIWDGALRVDGRRVDEPHSDPKDFEGRFFGPVRVPAGTVFVLGDHRRDSEDSREFGAVPVDDLIGRARARIWPPERWGGWG
jgi:signal peptidase I